MHCNTIDNHPPTTCSKRMSAIVDPLEQEETSRKRPASSSSDGTNDDQKVAEMTIKDSITIEGELPQKRFYRQRAHANPLSHNDSFQYPIAPSHVNWRELYETSDAPPTVLDIGCGFGGLTMRLCRLLSSSSSSSLSVEQDERILGLEIRTKVTEYVRLRILHARKEQQDPAAFRAAVLRTNAMKYFPNYFGRCSLNKIFICFPDPHFKRKNHPRRIVSTRLLSEYAYGLKITGRLYLITDVQELHEWHLSHCDAHPLFRRLFASTATDNIVNLIQEDDDPCIEAMRTVTEEGKKVERNKGEKYYAVYERVADKNDSVTITKRLSANSWFGFSD